MATEREEGNTSSSDVIRQASRLLGQAAELLTSVPSVSGANERPVASSSRVNRATTSTGAVLAEHRRLFAPVRNYVNVSIVSLQVETILLLYKSL